MTTHQKLMATCTAIAVIVIAAEIGFISGIRMYAPLMRDVRDHLASINGMLFNTLPAPPSRSYAELVQKNAELIEKQGKQIEGVLEVARRSVNLMDSIAKRQDKREARQVKVETTAKELDERLKVQENIEANRSTPPRKSLFQPGRK